MAESYFFALFPRFLKVQHSFAKAFKSETRYRLVLYKGIQKCNQMKQSIHARIVGGKIDLSTQQLSFDVPYFNPNRNVQFTIKLNEQRQNQDEKEIASYAIMSSDYVKLFKSQKQSHFQVNGMLLNDLTIEFDLLLAKSKFYLKDVTQKYLLQLSQSKGKKQPQEDAKSQKSQLSRQFVRNGNGFISPKRRLQRKKSPEVKPSSRAKSINKNEGSFTNPVTQRTPQVRTSLLSPSSSPRLNNLQISQKNANFNPRNSMNVKTKNSSPQLDIAKHVISKSSSQKQIKHSEKNDKNIQQQVEQNISISVQSEYFPAIKITTSNPFQQNNLAMSRQTHNSLNINRQSLGLNFNDFGSHQMMQQSNIRIFMEEGTPDYQTPEIIDNEDQPLTLEIEQKNSVNVDQKVEPQYDMIKTGSWNRSIRPVCIDRTSIGQSAISAPSKQNEQRKNQLFYAIFLIVSAFLIYIAMTPTRRV